MSIPRGCLPRVCIYSTVEDLHKWERALSTDALLPRSELEAMWSKRSREYGYGWQILPPSPQTLNRSLVLHAGGISGLLDRPAAIPE